MPQATLCIDCNQITERSPCPQCTRQRNKQSPYQTKAWRRTAKRATRGKTCTVCGSSHYVTAHHIEARRQGGPDEQHNLVPLCGSCHSQYEADKRAGKDTDLRRLVDASQPPIF